MSSVQTNPDSHAEVHSAGVASRASVLAGRADPAWPQLEGYRFESVLGDGETSVVFLAEQERPVRRRVAIKVVRPTAHSTRVLERFDVERQTVAMMEHRGIARFYGAGTTDDGRAYFVMEYVHGVAVTEFCTQEQLTLRERLTLFCGICAAIEHAHQRGVIHRDLKPLNILALRDDDGRPETRVIDFGIAKAIDGATNDGVTTSDGRVFGTTAYMSPEQLLGDAGRVDTRTDVYALGVVLYEMLSGRPAYDVRGLNPATAVARVMSADPIPLRMVVPQLPADGAAVVAKAMARDVGQRYGSVAELRADVERLLADRPVTAGPPGVLYAARKFASRHRAPLTVAATALVVIGLLAARSWQAAQTRYELAAGIAEDWLGDVIQISKRLGDRASQEPVVSRLVDQSARLVELAPRDARARSIRARALHAMGDIELERRKLDQSLATFLEVKRIRAELAAEQPDSLDRLMDLSIAMVRVGDAHNNAGRGDEARAWFDEALALDERAVSIRPDLPRAVSNLGWSYDRLAVMAANRGQPDQVAEYRRKQLAIMLRLNALVQSPDAARGLSVAYLGLEAIERDPETAQELRRKAIQAARAACQAGPSDYLAHRQVVTALQIEQQAREKANAPAEDLFACAQELLAEAQALVEIDPDDPSAADLLAHSLRQAALRAVEADELEQSRAYRDRAISAAQHFIGEHGSAENAAGYLAPFEACSRIVDEAWDSAILEGDIRAPRSFAPRR